MKTLKTLLYCAFMTALLLSLNSCDLDDDDGTQIYFEALEVVEAEFPESFEPGRRYRINVTMRRPSNCHIFEGWDFIRTGDTNTERTIYGVASVLDSNNCTILTGETITTFFNFEVVFTETYVFKLYSGTNDNGEEEFLIYEVPVEELAAN